MTTFGGLTPSSDSQINYIYRVQSYQYGNGYKAVAPDGANSLIIQAQVNFDYLAAANSSTLDTWLFANPQWVAWAGDGTLLPSSKQFRVLDWQKTGLPGGVNQ